MGLAVLTTMAGAAQAQESSVQIYGIVDAGVLYTSKVAAPVTGAPRNTGSRLAVENGLLQSSRLGFRGKEDLGGGLYAEFGLENGFSVDNGAALQGGALFGRRSIVGLGGAELGVLQLGRRKDFTDEIAAQYSSITPFSGLITAVHANNLDRIGGNRANNMIYYSTPTIAGFRANVTYGFGEVADSKATGQSIGFGANYDNGPFGIGFGYWTSKLGSSTVPSSDQGASSGAGCATTAGNPGQTCIKTWIIGTGYTLGAARLRGTFSRVNQPLLNRSSGSAPNFNTTFSATTGTSAFTAGGVNNDRASIVDVGVDYVLTPQITLTGSFLQSRYHFVGASGDGKLTQLIAGIQYFLSKRTTLYSTVGTLSASSMYNPGISGGAPGADSRSSVMAAGIRHTF
jgi:predicted porin